VLLWRSRRNRLCLKSPPALAILLVVFLCLAVVLCMSLALLWSLRCPGVFQIWRRGETNPGQPAWTLANAQVLLASSEPPPRDPYDLARRLKGLREIEPPPLDQTTGQASAPAYAIGDRETFWVLNLDSVESFQISATLRHISPRLYMWVQDGLHVEQSALQRSAQTFEERLYPTVRRYFGAEWSPGIDGDERLSVLNARFSGTLGYFSSGDEYPAAVMPNSNQREMFYINPEYAQPGSTAYDGTLAHELQHMVHWYADPNEDTWVSEGASELALHLCGYSSEARTDAFARRPDIQLTNWEQNNTTEHYGASFLFLAYFAERFGPSATRELVQNERNGIWGFEAVLRARQSALSFSEVFADWVIANYLDGEDTPLELPYAYQGLDIRVQAERTLSSYPAVGEGTVHPFAADYIELEPTGQNLRLDFRGDSTARLVPNQAHSGRYQWWSNRSDNSDMTLTRSFDLRGLKKASLEVWLWYDIEEGWDYAYVQASSNGGETWQILPGQYTTTENPSGNSYGAGYTGSSGQGSTSGASAVWVQETFDLSAFAGKEVWIRFEYLTDEAVHRPGLCIDDIRIPELGYEHDAETGDGDWVARGFVRCDNTVPQRYIVQVIRLGESASVTRLALEEDQRGSSIINMEGSTKAVLVISSVTLGTTEPAKYRYELYPTE